MYEVIVMCTAVIERITELFITLPIFDNLQKSERTIFAFFSSFIWALPFVSGLDLNIFQFYTECTIETQFLTAIVMGLGTKGIHFIIKTYLPAE